MQPAKPDHRKRIVSEHFIETILDYIIRRELNLFETAECASMLINRSWGIRKLQYWFDHSDTQTMLNIHAHFNRQRLNTSDNNLSEIPLISAELSA